MSPTRELSMQTFGVLREVMQDHTQTYGLIMGGADRKSEAVKLAKGKTFKLNTLNFFLLALRNSEVVSISCHLGTLNLNMY